MAALCTCDGFVLLSNGRNAAIINFSSPDEIQQLNLPAAVNAASAKPQPQATSKKSQKVLQQNDSKTQKVTSEGQQENAVEPVQDDRLGTENRILACAVSTDGQLVALCDDRKCLHVYKLEDGRCRLHFSSPVAHRCTSVTFSGNSQQVIVADKSGDAHVFDVQQQHGQHLATAAADTTEDQTVSGVSNALSEGHQEDNGVGGSLLLGHHSMLLDVLTVDSDRLVVTCDRDEKIRISHYPDGYNIQAYCLGHAQFVISLAYDESKKLLISGSGDATVRVWTLAGKEVALKNVLPDIPAEKDAECAVKGGVSIAALSVDSESNRQDVSLSAGADSNREKSRTAIQQICYCSKCQLLFVAIYRSPDILVYRLQDAENTNDLTLEFFSILSGEGHVASMCVGQCVLWVVRQGAAQLSVSAFRVETHQDAIKLVPVSEDKHPEFTVLKTFSSQPDLLQVTAGSLDLIPSLWKTPFHEDFKYESNLKRHKENGSKKQGKKLKTLKQ